MSQPKAVCERVYWRELLGSPCGGAQQGEGVEVTLSESDFQLGVSPLIGRMRLVNADQSGSISAVISVIGLICGEFTCGAALGGFPSRALKPPLTFQ